ncbi:MAG: hypothetical protein BWY09_01783 [Candidatus Hydrogenedentes bacterium ADurb.Bin179]|nr:MAG: hypothetical protein BWY09_01783 [Candidatus Hydrogenedentes bacterium ADurb.Bin179]
MNLASVAPVAREQIFHAQGLAQQVNLFFQPLEQDGGLSHSIIGREVYAHSDFPHIQFRQGAHAHFLHGQPHRDNNNQQYR